MNDLFNRKDILTIATADKAVIGTKGFFGDNLEEIIDAVKQNKIRTLSGVDMLATYIFWSNEEMDYMFFLPADRVKNKVKEPVYRPIKTIDEENQNIDRHQKAELTLSRIYELKDKVTGNICYKRFSQLCLPKEGDSDLKHFFENYEIMRLR